MNWCDNWTRWDHYTGQPDGNFDVEFGPVTFTTRETGPFRLEEFVGWFNGVDRGDDTSKTPNGHGQQRGTAYYGPRAVTVEGHVFTIPDRGISTLWQTMQQLDTVKSGIIRVASQTVPFTEADATVASLRWTPLTADVGTYTIVFTSDRPEIGSAQPVTLSTGTAVTLRNEGNTDAGPVVEWTGSATNPGLTWSGGSWRLGQNIPSGGKLRVNFLTGHIWLNGQRILPPWTGTMPLISPGQQLTVTAVGGPAVARRESAWI